MDRYETLCGVLLKLGATNEKAAVRPLAVRDAAAELGVPQSTVYTYLLRLQADGCLDSVGNRISRRYWLTDAGVRLYRAALLRTGLLQEFDGDAAAGGPLNVLVVHAPATGCDLLRHHRRG